MFQGALRAAKRVATETGLGRQRVSIPSVAVADFASGVFERFDDKRVLLVGAALIIGQPWLGATAYGLIVGTGASLVLGGVAQLLTPTPTLSTGTDSETDPRRNYSFSSIQNTSRQGTPVPIVYGETIVGSVVISVGLDVDQVSA